ncbi:MAG: phosphoribosylaminoimidazolesuccinocarboxamide synthase [Planctomycetota bacterium]|nr:phosphoribosylaminoimidazolesuccinocarboxamide synthase [Planctomycetota bacterium]
MTAAIATTALDGLELVRRGKVRDCYAVGDALLLVATDRLSAYDVVLSPPIPDKGRILTSLSLFWFKQLEPVVPNHLITADVDEMPAEVREHADILRGRCMLVKRLTMLPIECVARGYLVGSGWKDYRATGAVCGHALPADLPLSARLDPPLFTPATKAPEGEHDENISVAESSAMLGADLARQAEDITLTVYARAREIAAERGVIIADTKFEFGHDADGVLTLGDEVLTPDSSRFWDAAQYREGENQESFDKQFVRDWLDASGWNRKPPAPQLPPDVVARTTATYREIHRRITGRDLSS